MTTSTLISRDDRYQTNETRRKKLGVIFAGVCFAATSFGLLVLSCFSRTWPSRASRGSRWGS
jgi:hypothetical protein